LTFRSENEKCAKEKYLDLKILEAGQGSLIVFVCSVLNRLFYGVLGGCDAAIWGFLWIPLIFDRQVRE
jgi:hypothetical protein